MAADRLKKAEKQTKQREDAIISFNSLLWTATQGDGLATMPAQKAIDKLQQTMLWVAEDKRTIGQLLGTREWRSLNEQLQEYVSGFRQKIVPLETVV